MTRCPRCGSAVLYREFKDIACMTCGERIYSEPPLTRHHPSHKHARVWDYAFTDEEREAANAARTA